ncbi:MAG TPA: Crp/Fnr family transcriptional regulator [Methylomirabilota bacterium]
MPAKDTLALLRSMTVFAGLPAREIESLAALAIAESHRARASIFTEGDAARWLYVVKSGHVKIVRQSRAGKDVVLDLLGPGEIFGGVAVIERRPYPASAVASEASVVLKIPAEPMIAVAERYPAFIREMALMIGRRLRDAHDSVKALAVDPVEARLAATLLRLAGREGVPAGRGVRLPYHLTRQSLADMSGTTVETAIRILGRWSRAGLLDEDDGLVVLDPDGLRERAEGEEE